MKLHQMTKADKALGIGLLIFSILLFIIINYYGFRSGESYVSIQINGKEVKQYSLPVDKEIRYYYTSNKEKMTIVIKEDQAFVMESSCPDKLCISKGAIKKIGDMIVCVPNHVVIEIKAMNSKNKSIDSVNY